MKNNRKKKKKTTSGSLFYPKQASSIRKGDHILIKDKFPCKVVDTATSKTGKHGHAKVRITALDIFTGNKYEDMQPGSHNVNVPNVTRKEYPVMDIDGEYLTLLDDKIEKGDVKVPDGELGEKLKADFEDDIPLIVTVIGAMGQEQVIQFKENK